MSNAITKAQQAPQQFEFTAEQRKMIRESFLSGAPESEAVVLLELARIRRLNPITQQIHFVQRWNGQRKTMVWAAQVGIDGLRAIAERTGKYDGQDEPEFEYEGKQLKLCRVKVYRKDWARPAVGVAHFTEYAQAKKEGGLTAMWATKPHVMLAKCAEALAFRKAFPDDTSGLYAPEEMGDERAEVEVNPPPTKAEPETPRATGTQRMKERLKPLPEPEPAEVVGDEMVAIVAKQLLKRHGVLVGAQKFVQEAVGKSKLSELTADDLKKLQAHLEEETGIVDDEPAVDRPQSKSKHDDEIPF